MSLNKEKSIMGDFAIVKNHNAHRAASKEYVAVLLETKFRGSKYEKEYFFTEKEYASLRFYDVAFSDLLKKGHLYECTGLKDSYCYVKTKCLDGETRVCRITNSVLSRALERADKNPEDHRPRGFIRNLLD